MECNHVSTGDISDTPSMPNTMDTRVAPDTPVTLDTLDTPDTAVLDTPKPELPDLTNIPLIHVGIIPDGNRRWCKKNNKDRFEYAAMVQNMIMNLYNEYKDKTRSDFKYPTFNMVK